MSPTGGGPSMHRLSIAALVMLAGGIRPAWAGKAEAADKIRAGNAALAAGKYAEAQEAYRLAEVDCPECPEIAYNQGLASYRTRDFEKARELFNAALATRDLGLEARAKYNLGNVAYSQALEKLTSLEEAINHARAAIGHYRDALELDGADEDARANIETAQLLIKDLLDKQKQEAERQKQQQQQKQDQTSQPSSQCDNPQAGQENDQQKQEQQDQQEQDQQGEQDKQKQQEEKKDGKEAQPQAADGQNEQQPQAEPQEEQQEEAVEAPPAERRELTGEEAEQLLQAVRDKEAKRRTEQARIRNARRAPVKRDW